MAAHEAVSAVVVSFSHPAATRAAIDSLLRQSAPPVEVLLVDNHPGEALSRSLDTSRLDSRVRLIHRGENLGYTAACNLAAAQARGDWLFFLNPDARADPRCLSLLLDAADGGTAVIGAQVLLPDGRTNAGDNPVHMTGVSWAGRFGQAPESGPARDVAAVSGAALLARASAFSELGGLCARFFLYQDDVDLCWRARLAGWTVRFCPDAVVWHDYEFDKGTGKWYWLERNRLWSVLSNYSLLSLLLLSPVLAGAEMAVAAMAIRGHWFGALLRAWRSTFRDLPALLHWRRQVQASRRTPDGVLMKTMVGRFETPLLESPMTRLVNPLVASYRSAVLWILRAVAG
jgi:GT2 family glycosyltransferase